MDEKKMPYNPQNLISAVFRFFWVGRQPKRWHVGQLVRWLVGWRRGWRVGQRLNRQEAPGAIIPAAPTPQDEPPKMFVFPLYGKADLEAAIRGKNLALVRRLIAEYRLVPGGPHGRLVALQRDMLMLVETGFFTPVWDGWKICYYPAGSVPYALMGRVITRERLLEVHREELRKSGARWN